ncbi:MAG: O-antigen ligase family protein [Thermoleophilia bacterium]|jgi:hypothetical protein
MTSTTPDSGGAGNNRLCRFSLWSIPLLVLFAVWLWLVFASGGSQPSQWLPSALLIGFLGLVVAVLVYYPRRPRQLSLVVLTLFALYTLWVAASALWADSIGRVWLEASRSFGLLLLFALALTFLTNEKARTVFRYLLMAAALTILVVCIGRLWSAEDVTTLFTDNRLNFPTAYPNGSAALFLLVFWPLMWLAAAPAERAPVRGVALGLATGLLGLAVMTQSRTAIYSMGLSLIIVFVISPIRLRTLFYLIPPGLLMVYAVPTLTRYWLEGPEAVGGGAAARTLIVATLATAFMGMIMALLEKWIPASRRMKAIFGTVVLSACLVGAVYGSIVSTADIGGPSAWLSQSWHQFISNETPAPDGVPASRLTVVDAGGGIDFWRVAWQTFESHPVLGVGADHFVYQYERLRSSTEFDPQYAHSLELQVLADTGAVGGGLLIVTLLLSLGGLLWGRCTAGRRHSRQTWLHIPGHAPPADTASYSHALRWGDEPQSYGWDMAILSALSYWLIHASVDQLWQMTGTAIPALLLLAAGLSGVDARNDGLWPRLERRLRITRTTVMTRRRRSRHDSKTWRQKAAERIQPTGPLSIAFRVALLALSVAVIIGAALPYLSLQCCNSALTLAQTDGLRAAAQAEYAHWLSPGDPGPYDTQAGIYAAAATTAAAGTAEDRTDATLDNLALAIAALERAIEIDPAEWSLRYRAGITNLNLLIATTYATDPNGPPAQTDYPASIPSIPGLGDWRTLPCREHETNAPGTAGDSLWPRQDAPEAAKHYRSSSPAELCDAATAFLQTAQERNPLSTSVVRALELAQRFETLLDDEVTAVRRH